MALSNRPWGEPAPTMNRKRVITLTSVSVGLVLFYLMITAVGGLPPWPVLFWFAISHGFFCWVILRVKPYRGPYTAVMRNEVPESPRRD